MNNESIKPCPFCKNGKGRVVTRVYDDGDTFGMSCNSCYIRMEAVYHSKEEAIRIWNIRPTEALEAAVRELDNYGVFGPCFADGKTGVIDVEGDFYDLSREQYDALVLAIKGESK